MAKVKKIKKVKKIPAVQILSQTAQEAHKIRAAAYVRVSTDHDDQEGSYEAQKEYFEKRIQFNQVQLELKHRQPRPGLDYSVSPFFYSVFCSSCGGIYGRKTTHSNIQQWKKIIWKCNKLSTAWEHQPQTPSEILQTCNHRKQPANKMPTLNEHNLYLIFFRSLQKLYFASSLGLDTKIAGLDHEIMVLSAKQEDMLALLKNMIGDIQMKNRKEQRKAYERSVEKYNHLKEDYEKQGDILYQKQELQTQLTTLQAFLASVPTEKLSYQADQDSAIDKEWLSQTYRELHIKMTVYADHVAVQFAEGIVIDVKLKNGAKSGEIDEDLSCIFEYSCI